MKNLIIFYVILIVILLFYVLLNRPENFDLDSYLRHNYESGANMLRGDLDIIPTQQSWFNTKYGPSNLVQGYFSNYNY
jgi:hypothetical protein